MPEEMAPATQETPDAPEPTEAPDSQGTPSDSQESKPAEVNWQDRYENLQPEYTRASQEAAQYRQIIDLARQGDPEALNVLGLESADDTEEDEDFDPDDSEARLSRMEAFFQEQAEAHAEQELQELEQEFLDYEVEELGEKLTDKEQTFIKRLALATPDSEGLPDVKAAYEEFKGIAEERQAAYLESKKAPQVNLGTAGSEDIDMSDPQERVKHMAAIVEAARYAE